MSIKYWCPFQQTLDQRFKRWSNYNEFTLIADHEIEFVYQILVSVPTNTLPASQSMVQLYTISLITVTCLLGLLINYMYSKSKNELNSLKLNVFDLACNIFNKQSNTMNYGKGDIYRPSIVFNEWPFKSVSGDVTTDLHILGALLIRFYKSIEFCPSSWTIDLCATYLIV